TSRVSSIAQTHAAFASGGMTHHSFSQDLRSFFCACSAPLLDRERPRLPGPPAYPPAMARSRAYTPVAPGCTPGPRDALLAPRRVGVAWCGRVAGQGGIEPGLDQPLAPAMDG